VTQRAEMPLCTSPFADCRETQCCTDKDFSCYRRSDVYFAQCRPKKHQQCGGSEDDWLCPGWEACAANGAECTLSRCCLNPGDGCFLNRTLFADNDEWRAFCEPPLPGTARADDKRVQLNTVKSGEKLLEGTNASETDVTSEEFFYVDVSSKHAFCEGTPEWRCLEAWRTHASEYADFMENESEYLIKESGMPAAAIVGITMSAIFAACCAIAWLLLFRRRWSAQLKRLENNLQAIREEQRATREKKRGGEEGTSLVEEGGHEIMEEEAHNQQPTRSINEFNGSSDL